MATKKRGCGCNRASKKKPEQQQRQEKRNRAEGSPEPTEASVTLISAYGAASVEEYQIELDAWIDAPFRHMGETRNGTDCIGLVLGVYKQLGMLPNDLRPTEYARQWYLTDSQDRHPAFEQLKERVGLIRIDDPKKLRAGDIACFAYGKGIEAHVALISSRGSLIHSVAGEQADKVIESRFDDNRWRKRFVYAYRITTETTDSKEDGR